jgi:hypothetical protein
MPPVLPHDLVAIPPRRFNEHIFEQSERLKYVGSPGLIEDLEREFRSFKAAVHDETALHSTLEAHGPATSFKEAWRPFGYRFPLLKRFCGGLASVFPGTATVESDFSLLNWEFDEFRTSLTELSLEGILQCKQFKKLSGIQHATFSSHIL